MIRHLLTPVRLTLNIIDHMALFVIVFVHSSFNFSFSHSFILSIFLKIIFIISLLYISPVLFICLFVPLLSLSFFLPIEVNKSYTRCSLSIDKDCLPFGHGFSCSHLDLFSAKHFPDSFKNYRYLLQGVST